jgi:NADH pyrophosphatase NudC (nudix superfamily)
LKVNLDAMYDARWFTREEIIKGLENGCFSLPTSIFYSLIRDWFDSVLRYNLENTEAAITTS